MIMLIGRLRITAEKRADFLEYLQIFLAASRAETGCLRFTVSEDIEHSQYFLFTEIWEDEASLHAHENSAHLALFKQQIGTWIIEREKSRVYTIAAARDL